MESKSPAIKLVEQSNEVMRDSHFPLLTNMDKIMATDERNATVTRVSAMLVRHIPQTLELHKEE